MNQEEKNMVARAVALMGTTMAGFMHMAKEKAHALLGREERITMTNHDFEALTSALNVPFIPNIALQNALDTAGKVKRG